MKIHAKQLTQSTYRIAITDDKQLFLIFNSIMLKCQNCGEFMSDFRSFTKGLEKIGKDWNYLAIILDDWMKRNKIGDRVEFGVNGKCMKCRLSEKGKKSEG